jgi:hypothetical protein
MKAEDPSVSFTGEFSPNFVLKNIISTKQKFFMKKIDPNSPAFEEFLFKSPDFHDKFH